MSNKIKVAGRTVYYSKFSTRAAAIRWGKGWAVMGTAGEFWAVLPRDFDRLINAGYEPA